MEKKMKSNYCRGCVFGLGIMAMLISSHVWSSETLSYGDYKFEIIGMSQEEQIKKFNVDSKECSAEAEKQYQKNMEEAELLSKIYGQKMDNRQFRQLADAQFLECMTGFTSNNPDSKGWAVKK
jgi:hypothetical protein